MSRITIKRTALIFFLILADIAVYMLLGILLMDYDDSYEEGKGEYFSLSSMTTNQKWIWFLYAGWNLINIGFILYLIFFFCQKIIRSPKAIN